MTPKRHIYLIDGNAYIYRAYHAISPLSNKAGLPTHAIFGFTNIIHRVLRDKKPEYLAIAFDTKGPNFRHALYGDYKANRPPMPADLVVQIPYIKEVVAAHRFLTFEEADLEADDLLAASAVALANQGCQVTIVSGDKDLLQLVSDQITVWDPMSDRIMDRNFIIKKYNVPPEKLLDLFALMGDKSDNVPGVAGVGPKTAEKLINEFGSLDQLYDSLDLLPPNKMKGKISSSKQEAYLSRDLIRLKTDCSVPIDIDLYRMPEPDEQHLFKLYTTLEFTRLLQQTTPTETLDTSFFHLVSTSEGVSSLQKKLSSISVVAIDTETTSLDPRKAELVGISLAINSKEAYYLPLSHADQDGHRLSNQLSLEQVHELCDPLLTDSSVTLLGHNLKYDLAVLRQNGFSVAGPLYDTMLASYLLDPTKRSHKLDTLCAERGFKMTSFSEVTDGSKQEDSFRYVSIETAKNYSCEDVAATWLLWKIFQPQLEENGLFDLFEQIETPLIPVLVEMESTGIRINCNLLDSLSKEFGDKLALLHQKIISLAGRDFNLNSPKQLAAILFEELQLPHGRKTKTGYSTDIKVLEKLAPIHDLPKNIIEHRNLSKLKSTYIDKLGSLVNPKTGRVHTSFNQTVTATGRLSSSDPNLQNIPVRTEEGQRIREAFIPEEGSYFLAADYSQIDLRVLAHYSQDQVLMEAFLDNQDIHQKTAAEIFRVDPNFVTSQMRRVAKSINFGIVYGMSAFGLAGQLNISRKEAALFINRYFDLYQGVKSFMDSIIAQAKHDGFVTTLTGRKRFVPDINSPNKNKREFAERIALNTPIQGTAADIIKRASIDVAHQLYDQQLRAKILLQIHDELVLEVPTDESDSTKELLKQTMENCFHLDVPLVVNVTVGQNLSKT